MNCEQITEKDKSMNANEKKGNATKLRKVQNVQMAKCANGGKNNNKIRINQEQMVE